MEKSVAWAAGLFEGGGTITLLKGERPRLAVKMTDEQTVRRFGATMGLGKVYGPYGPYASELGKKPTFCWLADHTAALAAARLLYPWLSPRRRARLVEVFGLLALA